MESVLVARVRRLVTEDLAGGDDPQRWTQPLHRTNLYGGRMGAQHQAPLSLHVEGVLRVARGMVRRDIERLKVVPIRFDLGAVSDLITHRNEQVLDLPSDLRQRMQ